jgi:oligopeptide transport system ATP-binding protein
MSNKLIEITNLIKKFPIETGIISTISNKLVRKKPLYVHAVNGVSLNIFKGETLGLVGESGSGKSTLGKCIIRLIEPTAGKILFNGVDITRLSHRELMPFRRRMQIIFQDPYSSLNPRKTVGNIIKHMLELHNVAFGEDARERVHEILELVGLGKEHYDRYPHQLSGGQRQRIAIARAIAITPEFVIADEPFSALDVSVQAQVLNLLIALKKKFNLTYLLISHDLGIVRYLSDRVGVMYLGKILELSSTENLYSSPMHPYTQSLLSAVPSLDPDIKRNKIILRGEIPNPVSLPSGCVFNTRCPYVRDECKTIEPALIQIKKGHYVACHLYKSD